jgi:MGT family glycosyltransferase
MSHAAVVFQAVLKAVADLDARVLLTVGRKFDAAALGRVPANAHVEAWVDQDSVMSHANVVVCHGGSGTVLGALESGVPLVTVPVFADQFENSRRVAAVGAGRTVEVHSRTEAESRAVVTKDDAPRIRAEVDRVLSDSSYGDRARLIAREMAAYPTVEQVMDEFVP